MEADAQIRAALAGLDPKVRVGASTDAAKLAATDLRVYLDALVKKIYQFRLVADDKQAQAALTRLYGQALRLDKAINSEKQLTVQGVTRVQAQLLGVDASLDKISQNLALGHVEIDDADAERRLAFLTVQITAMVARAKTVKLGITDPGVVAEIAAVQARLAELAATAKMIDIRVDTEGLTTAEGELGRITGDLTKLVPVTEKATNRLAGLGTWFRVLGTRVSLFDRNVMAFLGGITVIHLLADAFIELAAVIIPAAVAFVAFGAVAVPTAEAIFKHMQALQTVTEATGRSIYPLTGAFGRLADEVQPQVYQLFGDALTVINRKTGEFAQLAMGAGHVLDQLAARAAVAFGGSGMSAFLRNAVTDLAKITDIFANLFGVVGNFLKVVPGYANVLLSIVDRTTKVLETLTGTGFVQGILRFGLMAHGAFVYAGVGATLFAKLTRTGLGVVSTMATQAAGRLIRFGGAGERAGAALGRFASMARTAAGLPWAWIAVIGIGIGILAYKFLTAKDATQQWLSSLQQVLMAAPAVRGFTLLQQDQAVVAAKLAFAQIDVGKAQEHVTVTSAAAGKGFSLMTTNVDKARKQVGDLTAGLHQQQAEARLYTYRLGLLSAMYGGVAQAQGLLVAAGVTFREMMDKSREGLALLLQKVAAMVAAYSAMGQRAGVLGADLNALTIAGSDQVTQMGKLNQAWDTTIGIVSGGQSTFIAFEQALQKTSAAAKTAGASMGGLNAPSLQLRLEWQNSFTAGTKLIDALRMMSSVSPGGFPSITRAVKDALAQMIPLGKQTGATRAELVSLAQEVKPGITNFTQLTKWLGNTHDAGKDLNKILEKSGIDIQDLTTDAKKLSEILTSQVTSAFSAARLKASGVDDAIRTLASDMTNPHTWGQIHADQLRLYEDLRRSGMGAKAAASLVSTLAGQLFRIKDVKAKIKVTGTGHWDVVGPGGPGHHVGAKGWRVPGYGGGDRWPALLEGGEAVVPKHLVAAIAPFLAANNVPGFAAGGVAGSYGDGVTGLRRWVGREDDATLVALERAVARAVARAIRTGGGGGGALGGDPGANKALARRMFPWPSFMWTDFDLLEMREAGYNRFARNPSSGAYGIPQALPESKLPFAGQSGGGSHAGAQLNWMFGYIRQRYGDPLRAWGHEMNFGWYGKGGLVPKTMDRGGWIPPGPTLMMNRTGRAEHLAPSGEQHITIEWIGSAGTDRGFMNWLKKNIRINGGDPAILGR